LNNFILRIGKFVFRDLGSISDQLFENSKQLCLKFEAQIKISIFQRVFASIQTKIFKGKTDQVSGDRQEES